MSVTLRRGMPRVPGGPPWPSAPAEAGGAATAEQDAQAVEAVAPPAAAASASAPTGQAAPRTGPVVPLRRGLPRVPGGAPWPREGTAPAAVIALEPDPPEPARAPQPAAPPVPTAAATIPGEPRSAVVRPRRWPAVAGGALGVAVLLAVVVLLARWLREQPGVQDFLAAYPGPSPLPEDAPVGIPPWLQWQHFFNLFFMVLIVRTGLQVRTDKRPAAHWAPRSDPSRRSSLMAWSHQALDLFWVANGLIYLVLLLVTGQWVRIVPTSWEVFPNAASAALQYASLAWPTDNGWVHYNGLQQLAYFVTVFIAAPLAIASGLRMSVYWPKRPRADRLIPITVARRVHFPVMFYFVGFVIVHVTLVFATDALRNLNHMFGEGDTSSWVGLGAFAAALAVIVAAALALRPVLIAPVARLFGVVSGR